MNSLTRQLVVIITIISILAQPLFFSFMGLLGLEYEGADSSPIYVIYIVLIAALTVMAYLYSVFIKGFLWQEVKLLLLILILFSIHMLWVVFDPLNTELIPKHLIFFILFGLPGLLSAATIIKLKIIPQFIRTAEILFILIGCGIITFSVIPTFTGIKTASLGGASYQVLSYYSALTFGMLLFYVTKMPNSSRVSFSTAKWYQLIVYVIMAGCLVAVIIGGGRGAFLLLIAYLVLFFISRTKNLFGRFSYNDVIKQSILLMLGFLVTTASINYFWEKDFIQYGIKRATQFISSEGGIDLKHGSSGRDVVYKTALNYIENSPVIGYGPFGYMENTIQGHNIFLDVMLQFGILGFPFFMAILISVWARGVRNWTLHSAWVFSLLLYPLVMLMFSGVYLHTSLFIFGTSFFVIYKKSEG